MTEVKLNKVQSIIAIMKANATRPMDEVVDLIQETMGITHNSARSYYVTEVQKGRAPGLVVEGRRGRKIGADNTETSVKIPNEIVEGFRKAGGDWKATMVAILEKNIPEPVKLTEEELKAIEDAKAEAAALAAAEEEAKKVAAAEAAAAKKAEDEAKKAKKDEEKAKRAEMMKAALAKKAEEKAAKKTKPAPEAEPEVPAEQIPAVEAADLNFIQE